MPTDTPEIKMARMESWMTSLDRRLDDLGGAIERLITAQNDAARSIEEHESDMASKVQALTLRHDRNEERLQDLQKYVLEKIEVATAGMQSSLTSRAGALESKIESLEKARDEQSKRFWKFGMSIGIALLLGVSKWLLDLFQSIQVGG